MTIEPPSTVPTAPAVVPKAAATARLSAGHHLYPVPDVAGSQWRLSAPGDVFTKVAGPPQALERLRRGTLRSDDDQAHLLVEAFGARGLLADPAELCAVQRPTPRIAVAGEGPVAEQVRRLLTSWAEVTTNPVDGGSVDHSLDALVTCAGWSTDAVFRRLERCCREVAIAWHHCHLEGTSILVGPFSVPGGAGYEDWRGRRLAASTTPEELLSHWSYLERPGEVLPEPPWPRSGVVAVAAGLLVDELQDWWEDPAPTTPVIRHEYEVRRERTGMIVERHPVLPLPTLGGTR